MFDGPAIERTQQLQYPARYRYQPPSFTPTNAVSYDGGASDAVWRVESDGKPRGDTTHLNTHAGGENHCDSTAEDKHFARVFGNLAATRL
jgi:hypothetical protein